VRVLFDHQVFSFQTFGGASRYFAELMGELYARGAVEVDLGVARSPNEYLAHAPYYRGTRARAGGTAAFLARYVRNELCTRALARRHRPDVFHATFYDPRIHTRGAKLVVSVLDMIPERFPEFFTKAGLYNRFVTRRWIDGKRTLCERADAILAISEHTKRDVVDFYQIDPARITVTHLGNRLVANGNEARPDGFPARYVRFVGTRTTY
jgi:hypothetical protein